MDSQQDRSWGHPKSETRQRWLAALRHPDGSPVRRVDGRIQEATRPNRLRAMGLIDSHPRPAIHVCGLLCMCEVGSAVEPSDRLPHRPSASSSAAVDRTADASRSLVLEPELGMSVRKIASILVFS